MTRVAVVGAGISGLTVAYELLQLGLDRTELAVLDSGDRPGGNIQTETAKGFRIEAGPNGFLDNSPPTLDLVRRLGIQDRLLPSRDSAARRFIFRDGRLHLVPTGPAAMLTSPILSLRGRLRVFSEMFVPQGGHPEETVFDFAARRIGKEAAEIFVDPMVSGVFAGNARQLELQAAFPRMAEMEARYGSLVKALFSIQRERRRARKTQGDGKASGGGGPAGPGGRLTSFLDGMEELPRALAAQLGPALRLETKVRGVQKNPAGGFFIDLEQGESLRAEEVVLACPAPQAAALVHHLDPALSSVLQEIPCAPISVAATAYKVEDVGRAPWGFGFLVPRGQGVRILGCLWTSSIWGEHRAPEGTVLLRTMLGGMHDPAAAGFDDDELLALAAENLSRTMGLRARPILQRIFRYPQGIPQYVPGHMARRRRIAAQLGR
ncbi:MAG: protoporphyrinogen oxidase, partial [Candidatus Eisenbacteria bacterium]|nr:protoporphyrinogen oxidase [Candidatus Eisenbacteria bacterium]